MTEDYNLYPMHVFRLVAKLGSVTKAAQHLHISQPAVSAHIRTMEKRCSEVLLDRTPRGVSLTTAGEVVIEMSNKIFGLYNDLPKAVDESLGRIRGEIVLAASSTPGTYLVPELIKRFIEVHPQSKPVLHYGDSGYVIEQVQNFLAPIGVIGDIKLPDLFEKVRIGSDTLQLVTATGNPIQRLSKIKPSDVKETTLLLREWGSSTRAVAELMLREMIHSFDRVLEIPSTDALKSSVASDLGVAVLSSWAIRTEVAAGLLAPVLDERFKKKRPFFIIKRKDRRLMGPALALWTFLKELKVES
ncbi:MAG: LysR family transcriptional regulator [Acidobacteria bacterium]|nr:LysR family transcriptional regulator [Acidobacteriota bacterium]